MTGLGTYAEWTKGDKIWKNIKSINGVDVYDLTD